MSDQRCKCPMTISVTGDGCRYCQPQSYIDSLGEWLDEERARVAELEDLIRYAQVESGVCMCGEDIQTHNQVSGHSPVDIWDHARDAVLESSTSKPFILHKQAEAVTHCLHRLRLATTADGCRNHIESEVRRLLGEAENAGGDR